ncbi:MAG: VCBS repeat-containing protein [Chitinophagaceae bacterium]|nr:VCBS repeat-containing protein [Chitinophagaceae bacterium]
MIRFIHLFLLSILASCIYKKDIPQREYLFSSLPADSTGILFENNLPHTEQVNPYTFRNFYNGGGVGIGDINNDTLPDIFLGGNLVPSRLYLNKGNFIFEDITEKAGIGTTVSWVTGISLIDINGDGFLDIYLCKSGPPGGMRRKNELFINSGNGTFMEQAAEYGLDFETLSVHTAFFDFDRDGDLDCYLLSNSIRSVEGYDMKKDLRFLPDTEGGNKFLMQENHFFYDVSQKVGIYTSNIGFGLGISIADINKDGWLDMYISNDFFERDYLYINQKNGTFEETLENYIREIGMGSMGADIADINNDAFPDIFVTEMLPEKDEWLKTTTQFETWDKYQYALSQGYYHQFGRNVLQLHNKDNTFSEIGRLAEVHATDWSWAALIFDMNNDGYKDIFVANGIYKDLLNQDYVNFISNPQVMRGIIKKEKQAIKHLIDSMPSHSVPNYAFENLKNLQFKNQAADWGLGENTYSNGSAYADLDNDGDIDIVINNVNAQAMVFRNNSQQMLPLNRTLSIHLKGAEKNTFAIGTKITIYHKTQIIYQELCPQRGFMSSSDYKLVFGLGKIETEHIDSLHIDWYDGKKTVLKNIKKTSLTAYHSEATGETDPLKDEKNKATKTLFHQAALPKGVDFTHKENEYNDFDRERLLFFMKSNEGPCLCVGDVNGDGLDDFYVGGAKGQAGKLFVQKKDGSFISRHEKTFEVDKESEDTDCVFFDANNDKKADLYVTSGGNEFSQESPYLLDRLYINGKTFEKKKQALPTLNKFESTATVEPTDFDNDGDIDLFVGGRYIPGMYGLPANGYILQNDGKGNFTDKTQTLCPNLLAIGMITDAKWADVNNDTKMDLLVCGEWMPIQVFIQERGRFHNRTHEYILQKYAGWYNVLEVADFNKDGLVDIFAGNFGLNTSIKASESEPVSLHINDFDQNGTIEQILTRYQDGKELPLVLRQDLVRQLPMLKKKYLSFKAYKNQTIADIFTKKQLETKQTLTAPFLETAVWIQNANQTFTLQKLPIEAQFSPVYAANIMDFDGDNTLDIFIGGNLYRAKPEVGISDASYGIFLKGNEKGNFVTLHNADIGIHIKGEIRNISSITIHKKKYILVAKNNAPLEVFSYK